MSVQIPSSDSRRNQYFIPGDGIARQVITADICKYLDNDALVRPGEYQGIAGFFIFAYRNLTKEMIEDLKADSRKFDQEKRKFTGGQPGARHQAADLSYVNSRTHAASHASDPTYGSSRSHAPTGLTHGGSSPHVPHPAHAHPPPSRGAPSMEFGRQQPSPYNEPQYTTQTHPEEYPSTSRAAGYPVSGYPATTTSSAQPRSSFAAPYPSTGYAGSDDSSMTANTYSSSGYGNQAPQMPPGRDYPVPPASTAPLQSNRGGMNTYPDSRSDARGAPPRTEPRAGYAEKRPADPYSYADPSRHYSDSRRRH